MIGANVGNTSLVLSLVIVGALLLAAATGERTGKWRTGLDATIFLVLTAGGLLAVVVAVVLLVVRLS